MGLLDGVEQDLRHRVPLVRRRVGPHQGALGIEPGAGPLHGREHSERTSYRGIDRLGCTGLRHVHRDVASHGSHRACYHGTGHECCRLMLWPTTHRWSPSPEAGRGQGPEWSRAELSAPESAPGSGRAEAPLPASRVPLSAHRKERPRPEQGTLRARRSPPGAHHYRRQNRSFLAKGSSCPPGRSWPQHSRSLTTSRPGRPGPTCPRCRSRRVGYRSTRSIDAVARWPPGRPRSARRPGLPRRSLRRSTARWSPWPTTT